MLPVHVALVPYQHDVVDPSELLRVAAALQVQLTRDFTPVWETPAVLSAFTSMDDLPPACIPLVIVPQGTLLQREHAFHTTEKGLPLGLLEKRADWSLAASHELLEIVCDPQGKRKTSARSLEETQGDVAYLLEICDPCQDSYYMIHGFKVSDFVTPRYYVPGEPCCCTYSFTGKVTEPLTLLDGGYITWYTSIPDSPVWQAKKDKAGHQTIGPMTIPAPASARHHIDYATELHASPAPAATTSALAAHAAGWTRAGYGAEVRADVQDILRMIYNAPDPPHVPFDSLISLLKDLAENNNNILDDFRNPATRSQILQQRLGRVIQYPQGVPSQSQFQAAYDQALRLLQGQSGTDVSGKFAALQMQGQT
jgi:hypothetical protein